jgi:hypothetical protein
MKTLLPMMLILGCALRALGQGILTVPRVDLNDTNGVPSTGGYAADLAVVHDAQEQALAQARQLLAGQQNPREREALRTAIGDMERASAALAAAGATPNKLAAALAAEQSAYQALLKMIPREFRVTQSPSGGRAGNAGQPGPRELDQLEMTRAENRYETESQAAAQPTRQQTEQVKLADRLKQLAQRQQDLNDRLRELQTALQEARTDSDREEIQRQLKRLRDEQRRMLSEVDELRQNLAESPNAASQAETRRQLDQTRNDMQRAAQQLEANAVSPALAAGARAQQSMQNLREDLRRQTSSQFSEQMRQLRNQARQLAQREDEIARSLQTMTGTEHRTLDDSGPRQRLVDQLAEQQSALTNLLAGMRSVTEQSESTEPLLSQQLYDTLRRADQAHIDNLLENGAQLADRGFLPQAGQAEQAARQGIQDLRRGVERAAENVLGNEADALRYAQNELGDLTRQVERELTGAGTNTGAHASAFRATNSIERAEGRQVASGATSNSIALSEEPASAGSAQSSVNGPAPEQHAQAGQDSPTEPGATGGRQNQQNAAGPQGGAAGPNAGERASATSGGRPGDVASAGDRAGNLDRLRQLAEQLGRNADGGGGAGLVSGPIMGNDFVNWSDRLRDVEQVLDSADLRDQLAAVRERVAGFRAEYRQHGRVPDAAIVRQQVLTPMTQARAWIERELARAEDARSLVPLDRDPVPEKYSDQVRQYYEKLGSAQ